MAVRRRRPLIRPLRPRRNRYAPKSLFKKMTGIFLSFGRGTARTRLRSHTYTPRGVFRHAHVAPENGFELYFTTPDGETLASPSGGK